MQDRRPMRSPMTAGKTDRPRSRPNLQSACHFNGGQRPDCNKGVREGFARPMQAFCWHLKDMEICGGSQYLHIVASGRKAGSGTNSMFGKIPTSLEPMLPEEAVRYLEDEPTQPLSNAFIGSYTNP